MISLNASKGDYGENYTHFTNVDNTGKSVSVEATKLILFVFMRTGEDFSEERV